jgi:hypothetical protein
MIKSQASWNQKRLQNHGNRSAIDIVPYSQ